MNDLKVREEVAFWREEFNKVGRTVGQFTLQVLFQSNLILLDTLVEHVVDKEEKVKQVRHQRALLDYFEIHGKSLSILQWASTKEIKATSK